MNNQNAIEVISLEQAIEGPLLACNAAQAEAMQKVRDVVCHDLLQAESANSYSPRYMVFDFQQDSTVQRLRIPLLSLVPVPSLQIEQLVVNYQAEVKESKEGVLNVKLQSEEKQINTHSQLHSYLNIRLRVGRADMPMGLAKLYQLFGNELISIEEHQP